MLPSGEQVGAGEPNSKQGTPAYTKRKELHRSHLEIMRTLWVMADKNGQVQITNDEIQRVTALGRRTVQMRTKELAKAGWIEKRFIRRTERFNEANVYVLKREIDDPRLVAAKKRSKNFGSRGCNGRTELTKLNYISKTNTSSTSSGLGECNLTDKQSEPKRPTPSAPPHRVYRPARRPNLTPEQFSLLMLALHFLKAPETAKLPDHPEPNQVLDAIEILRKTYIPSYDDGHWNHMVKTHGFHAFGAVVETVAMILKRIPREEGDEIHSPSGYLGGIFRKAKHGLDMRPDKTLGDWVEIEQRELVDAEDKAKSAERKKRKAERDALFQGFITAAHKISDHAVVTGLFEKLVFHRRTEEAVYLSAGSHYITETIRNEHMEDLCAAWSEACDQSVFVKLSKR